MKTIKLNWEDHIGLCYLAADKIIHRTPSLNSWRGDIINDLKAKLWMVCEGGGFNHGLGYAQSTYIMTALVRYHRELKKMYLRPDQYTCDMRPVYSLSEYNGSDYDCSSYDECQLEKSERKRAAAELESEMPVRYIDYFRIRLNTHPSHTTRALAGADKN